MSLPNRFKMGLCKLGLVVVILYANVEAQSKTPCFKDATTGGYTEPNGDIVIEYGKPLDITCVLYDDFVRDKGPNASKSITFTRSKGGPIEKSWVKVLNSSSAHLHEPNPPKSVAWYYCNYNTSTVCSNIVSIGTAPQNITDFDCISYNHDRLVCNWTAPENYVKTNYSLTYTLEGRPSRLRQNTCPKIDADSNRMGCVWTVTTQPQYRQSHEVINFTLTATNVFGEFQYLRVFNHFEYVLPNPPINLTVVNTTSNSIFLNWKIPVELYSFVPGLEHRILYQCEFGPKEWQLGGIIRTNQSHEVNFNLTNLKYAHALYDIRVSMKSGVATEERMWSNNSVIVKRTSSAIPGSAPLTNRGSFETISSGTYNVQYRDVYIYWQQISREERNGANFTYNITVQDHPNLLPAEMKNAYAKYCNLSIFQSYTFIIRSQNEVGFSSEKSEVHVPEQSNRVGEPTSFSKVSYGNGVYELSWEPPREAVTNYTIFWCNHTRDRPFQCDGYLNWTEVDGNLTVYNITVTESEIYQFAISANSDSRSSGMAWAACTVIHNQNIGKMKTVWINRIGPTFMEVGWKLDCANHVGTVEGFIIYYCQIMSPSQAECKGGKQMNVTIEGSTFSKANITDLIPYSTYMVRASVITKHSTYSQMSDPLFNTTMEAAPNPPVNLTEANVTNSSFTVLWEPPKITNGIIKYYDVRCSDIEQQPGHQEVTNYTFTNLLGYKKYKVSIRACTTDCSLPSEITVETKMGYPDKISKLFIGSQNSTFVSINWDKLVNPGGMNDFYEVQIKMPADGTHRTFNTTTTKYDMENCDNAKGNLKVSVRAVNIVENRSLFGPWSDDLEIFCGQQKSYLWLIVIIAGFAAIILIYLGKKLYNRYEVMKEVEVVLPKGLELTKPGWDEPKRSIEPDRLPCADEELLLDKISGMGRHSGESSGCSSAHESVTSSMDSASHLSGSSDSGTEHPRSSSSELRRRAVPTSRTPPPKDYVVLPSEHNMVWPMKSPPPENYCVLGEDPNLSDDHCSISMSPEALKIPDVTCDSTTVTVPYVVTGEVKPISPGYVQYNAPEPLQKVTQIPSDSSSVTPPYVLTGEVTKTTNSGYVPF